MKFSDSEEKDRIKLFFRLMLPYICVLIIPALIWVGLNSYVTNNNEEKIEKIISDNVENIVKKIDSNLDHIEYAVYLVSRDSTLDTFFKKKYLLYEDMLKYRKNLTPYSIGNGLMKEMYIYSQSSDVVITQNEFFKSPERFFESGYSFDGIGKEEWADNLRKGKLSVGYSPVMNRTISSNATEQILPYIRNASSGLSVSSLGAIGVSIDKDALLEGFNPMISEEDSGVFVYNKNGELIMSEGAEIEIDDEILKLSSGEYKKIKSGGKSKYVYVHKSENMHWKYYCYVPESYALAEIKKVNLFISIINILALILGIIVCMYITFKKNKSYLQVLSAINIPDTIDGKLSGFNEFEILKPLLSKLVDENDKNSNIIRNARVWRILLSSDSVDEDKLQKLCYDNGIGFSGEKFIVLVLEFQYQNGNLDLENRSIFIQQLFSKYFAEDLFVYTMNMKTSVVAINYDIPFKMFSQIIRQQIAKMNIEMFSKHHINVAIGVGKEATCLADIYTSYTQACDVIAYNRIVASNHSLMYEELPDEKTMYYYPADIETRFIKFIKNGETEEIVKLINLIYKENFEKRTLGLTRVEALFEKILSTINSIKLTDLESGENFDYEPSKFTVNDFFDYLRDYVLSLCEIISFSSDENKYIKSKEILKWVEENYWDNTLSLISLGKKFKITSIGYLSMKFKEIANETFSSYLERIRIEKACALLLEGIMVKEVSEKVGYISDVSFRRAFKKRTGLSPKEYVLKKTAEK